VSLRCRCGVAAVSLRCRCGVAAVSLQCARSLLDLSTDDREELASYRGGKQDPPGYVL